jgi:hypothetical protein
VNIIADASVSQHHPPTDALNKIRFTTILKIMDNKIMEQIRYFNYLGNLISYDKEVYIDNKLDNYMKITGISNISNISNNSNNTFRPQKTPKKTQIKLYNTLALLTLLYGSENRTTKATDARRITAVEMKYMRKTVGYTWTDYKTDTEAVQN